MPPILLFDMDGTLVDSAQGVYQSLRYAMEAEGIQPLEEKDARHFLGEPLELVLQRRFSLDAALSLRIRKQYISHYPENGLYATRPIPGMVELTRSLHEKGFRLGIATCKPWIYCGPTLRHCGFADCFEAIAGSGHNGVPEEKTAVIREALRLLGAAPHQALMIGDRAVDVYGAAALGIPCIGISYCEYGEPGELEAAGAIAVAATAQELARLLAAYNHSNTGKGNAPWN